VQAIQHGPHGRRADKRDIAIEHQHIAIEPGQRGFCLLHRIAGAQLRFLHGTGGPVTQARFHLLARLADHRHDPCRCKIGHRIEQMLDHRATSDFVQHLVARTVHARTLARGQDHGGDRSFGIPHESGHAIKSAWIPLPDCGLAGSSPHRRSMSDFPFGIVLFDLDGTLVDSHRDLAPAVNHALVQAGREPVPHGQVRNFIGGGTAMMLERALEATGGPLPKKQMAELGQILLEYYWAHIADATVPFDGVHGALELLARHGCKLAVCTNKSERPARQLLDALNLTRHFAAIYGGDTLGPGRAKPQPDMLLSAIADCGGGPDSKLRAAMVGDSTYDVRAARNAGIAAITYRFGYHDVPVDQLAGDAMIDHFDALVPTLEQLA
jgi:phosphoglycolate phosphatase